MKRHRMLVPPSRDHHDGVLLPTRLKQEKHPLLRLRSHDPLLQAEDKKLTTMVERLRTPTEIDLQRHLVESGKLLEDHIHREERELFPLCEELVPEQEWEQIENKLKARQ